MKDKKINLTIFLFVAFLIIGMLGFSYAYFKPNVVGGGKTNVAVSGDLRLNFNDEVSLSQSAIYPGDSFTKVFTITNMGAETLGYAIEWEEYNNTFINGEIHISFTCLSYINYNTEQEEISEECEGIEEREATEEVIKDGVEISSGITHEYNVTITFIETGENQDYNKNKVFNATLKIVDNVALVLNLGGGETEQTFKSGYEPSYQLFLSNPQKDGYVFTGWDVAGFGSSIEGNTLTVGLRNTTIVANWLAYEDMYTYTGNSEVIDDGDGNWRIKFLTSGTFTPLVNMEIDVFLVGGGGGGASRTSSGTQYGPGGGGGYTSTYIKKQLVSQQEYSIVVGLGGAGVIGDASGYLGGNTSAFGYSASGGSGASATSTSGSTVGGNGGSGGSGIDGNPGSNGSNGTGTRPGTGQGTTTREFGYASSTLYSTGGQVGVLSPVNEANNTGNGGDGSRGSAYSGTGGSGIVVIKNTKINTVGDTQKYSFAFSGEYTIIDGNTDNWKIKLLGNGEFFSLSNMEIDLFLVGGGGGGASRTSSGTQYGPGGGGGYTATYTNKQLVSQQKYSIVVGLGGAGVIGDASGYPGGNTSAFGYSASGGSGASATSASGSTVGGNGGSGGSGIDGNPGSNGSNGTGTRPGTGQGTTTREFGEVSGTLYSTGGQVGVVSPVNESNNTGNGGDGSRGSAYSGAGGSGGAGYNGTGGSNGGNGTIYGGAGQGTTTREFGEYTGELYAGGGGGYSGAGGSGGGGNGTQYGSPYSGVANTGGGAGGDNNNAIGGSGIIVIRKKQ